MQFVMQGEEKMTDIAGVRGDGPRRGYPA